MPHRLAVLVLSLPLLAAAPALAAEPEAPVATGAMTTDDQIAAFLSEAASDEAGTRPQSSGAFGAYVPPEPDRRAHGEVTVAIGNHGYRSVSAMQIMPIGKTGTLAVAVEAGRMNGRRGRGYDFNTLSVGLGVR